MTKLTTFNVQGDAFLLEKKMEGEEKCYFLVDGGENEKFAQIHKKKFKKKEIKIVVCTHTDTDHANGIISYFQEGFTCEELWLPALWTSNLSKILNGEGTFLQDLANELKELNDNQEFSPRKYLKDTQRKIKEENISVLTEAIDNLKKEKLQLCSHHKPNIHEFFIYRNFSLENFNTFEEVNQVIRLQALFNFKDIRRFYLDTRFIKLNLKDKVLKYYGKIITIVLLALLRGVKKIRWWEFVEDNTLIQGKIDKSSEVLTPLCHRELNGFFTNYKALYQYALSKVNKESIVLLAKEDRLLISSDSDFSACNYIPSSKSDSHVLITSPHHGSFYNSEAFERIDKYLKDTKSNGIWIRTDSGHISMGDNFPRIQSKLKYCVNCYSWDIKRKRKAIIAKGANLIEAELKGKWIIKEKNCSCQFKFKK
ncbi:MULTISPECIES: MBL fold metallo-hydrolase [unclassified Priestia]|uniref:MBL fold metallo-hydrolase n=1 Tax=unclassified Priestia TaxID=2800374 RepID=UPI00366B8987